MKVDVLNEKDMKWTPGSILKVNKISDNDVKVEIKMEGFPDEFNF